MSESNDEITGSKASISSALLGGFVRVPIRPSAFGDYLDLSGRIPRDCDCIMVMLNSGGGLNAGYPKPVGFLKLPHQLYVADLEKLLRDQAEGADLERCFSAGTRWVTIVPVRATEYVDVWSADPPNRELSQPRNPDNTAAGSDSD